jgi:hypothetical protein
VKFRLVPGHPRLLITPRQLPEFRRQSLAFRKPSRDLLLAKLEPVVESQPALRSKVGCFPEFLALALGQAWRLTGDKKYGRAAHWLLGSLEFCATAHPTGYDTWGVQAEAAGILYDWLHDYWKQEGLEETAARITLFCARRALDDAQNYYILDDWHNYNLGLHAGAVAGALAVGLDHPKLEKGDLLKTLHAWHFTGMPCHGTLVQDACRIPKTTRCLDAALRSGNNAGFTALTESTGAYHSIDGYELTKISEFWTSALTPESRGGKVVWPELCKAPEALLLYNRPDNRILVWGDSSSDPDHPHRRTTFSMLYAQARQPAPHFTRWLAQNERLTDTPYPTHRLLRSQPADKKLLDGPALPTAALLDPLAVMRSSWQSDATMVSFRCGRHGGWHNHLDHNSFAIFRAGELAIDSGLIEYGTPHRPEYTARTLAHNSILVRNPDEPHWKGKQGLPTVNDGGQRLVTVDYNPPNAVTGEPHAIITEARRKKFADEFDMGHYVDFQSTDALDYVAGDATRAYTYPWSGIGDNPSRRVEEAVRQLVFLKPDLVVVFDRVEATQAHFEKKWLLHTINAPAALTDGRRKTTDDGIHMLSGGVLEFCQDKGRLTVWPLLPESREIRAVGGKGFEFWVDHAVVDNPEKNSGKNYPISQHKPEHGNWRIEVAPAKKSVRDCFLTVLHAGLLEDNPAAENFRCAARLDGGKVRLTVEQNEGGAWRPCAELAFNTAGPITADCWFNNRNFSFKAPAPKRVPVAKPGKKSRRKGLVKQY